VAEVFSPSTRRYDTEDKLAAYDRFGVRESWTIGLESLVAAIHRRRRGQLPLVKALTAVAKHIITTPLHAGPKIRVRDLGRSCGGLRPVAVPPFRQLFLALLQQEV
jgi:hypothetical protein